jgi:hypothetical protein
MAQIIGLLIFFGGIILIGILVVCITIGFTKLADTKAENKWFLAMGKDDALRKNVFHKDMLWAKYIDKLNTIGNLKTQIDSLVGKLNQYSPQNEIEWRTREAEQYKIMLFKTEQEAHKIYQDYKEYKEWVDNYCSTHKLKEFS